MSPNKLPRRPKATWGLVLVLTIALLVGYYSSARYQGHYAEVDSLSQVTAASSIINTRQLEGPGRYSNGYAYGAVIAFASELSGISPDILISWGNVWIVVFTLVAFITYRELLGDAWLAVLSTLLLFLFPDLMFYVLRGGHERATWMLALLMLFLLVRSLHYGSRPWLLLMYILGFYLIFWSMASTNIFFASTFAGATLISFLGSRVFDFLKRTGKKEVSAREHLVNRLLILSLICLLLAFVFISYTYLPALSYYFYMEDFISRTGLLLLGAQEDAGVPSSFSYLGKSWISSGAYIALVWPQFLIAIISFGKWLSDLRNHFSFHTQRWFLWWLYGAFGILLVLGTLADFGGFMQENLQMRMFTAFALFIAPMAALTLRATFAAQLRWHPRLIVFLGGIFVAYGILSCMLKVTNEPILSNVWLFYEPGEHRVGQWMKENMEDQEVWVDTWGRLSSLYRYTMGEYDPNMLYTYVVGIRNVTPPYVLITENTRLSANRRGIVIPAVYDHNLIYDNGVAEIYYRRPLTPYQK